MVTMLGTGSSVPSKYRNVTGILVETEPDSWILLDCGEGTFGQMVRLFGLDRTRQVNVLFQHIIVHKSSLPRCFEV